MDVTDLSGGEGSATDIEIIQIRDTYNLCDVQTMPRPKAPSMPREVDGEEGQSVEIPSKYPPTAKAVRWSKYIEMAGTEQQQDFQFLVEVNFTSGGVRTHEELTNSGFTVAVDREESVTVLVISPAKRTDSGLYYCMLTFESGQGFGKGTLVTGKQELKTEGKGLQKIKYGADSKQMLIHIA